MPASTKLTKPLQGLRFEHRPDFLVVHAWAPRDSMELALHAWGKIAAECAAHKCKRVLVIEDVQEILSTIDIFEFVERMPELGLLGVTIALVDPHPEHLLKYRFGETAATNRGIILKLFDNVPEAEAWLHAQSGSV